MILMKIFFLVALFLISLISCGFKDRDKKWKRTIGYITGGDDKYPRINYLVDSNWHEAGFGSSPYGLRDDEKYPLYYDSLNPENIKAEVWNPIFLPNEETVLVNGKIIRLFWAGIGKYAISFSYYIGTEKIKRSQELPKDFKQIYPNLKEGQYYEVEAWVDDANRAVIHLDKLMNASEKDK